MVEYECPGQFMRWSAFGAGYSDTVCASSLDWSNVKEGYPGAVLCDADDDFRPRGEIPCPFCAPEAFDRWADEEDAAAYVREIES